MRNRLYFIYAKVVLRANSHSEESSRLQKTYQLYSFWANTQSIIGRNSLAKSKKDR
jgi:hypothetical protein